VSALQSSIQRGEYQKVGNYHGAPTTLCGGQPCCPHGTNAFLPWHRLFMVHMEEELETALPYWDWSEEGEVPSLWESIKAPIQQGAVGQCSLDTFTSRDPRAQVNTSELKARVEVALMEETFEDFSEELMIPHNQLHFGMGCDMRVIDTSAYDPVFYLHHTYIDYIFAFWQELQRLRGHKKVPTTLQELANPLPLPPFDNRRYNNKSITLQNNRGRDTFEYTAKYCYKYQNLKFDGLTPAQFHRLHATVPMHIFIGIVVPKIMPTGYITFDLCLAGMCVQAGKVATFSIAVTTIINIDRQEINSRSHKLVKYDVTELVAEQNWKAEDNLEAMLTTSSLVALNLPKPVIIRRLRDQPYVVEVPQGKTPADYGDLLESYRISA